MAVTRTTLSASVSASTDTFNVTSATGATVGGVCKVNNEYSTILAIAGTAIKVRSRGERAGRAILHASLSPVLFCLPSDLRNFNVQAGGVPDAPVEVTISADGAIATPTRHTRVNIMKGSAAALTITQPGTTVFDGIRLEIHGVTLFAHTLTLTAGFFGNGITSDVATFAAGGGSVLLLESKNGLWAVVAGGTAGVVLA